MGSIAVKLGKSMWSAGILSLVLVCFYFIIQYIFVSLILESASCFRCEFIVFVPRFFFLHLFIEINVESNLINFLV